MTAEAADSPGASDRGDAVHMLSFDVEEYFQVEAARAGVGAANWERYPRRLEACVGRVLDLLDEFGAAATFFVLGWVARNEPDVVRRIAERGHEVASHGMTHEMLSRLGPGDFARELADSRKLLEDLAGQPVAGFRAPTFSVTRETAWAIDVLAEAGLRYDSSVFPVRHDRYGVPDAPRTPHHAVGPGGGRIVEIPPLTLRLAGANWPVGGGGYLRLLPIRVLAAALSRAQKADAGEGHSGGAAPGMIYLHPWELDPGQPVVPMGRLTRWRHRVNLARTESKLRWLLGRFAFTDVRSRLDDLAPLPDFRYG